MSPTTISPEGISIILPFLLTLVFVFNCSSWSLANAFSEPYSLILDINEAKNSIENTVMFKTKSPKKNLSSKDIREEYDYITKPTETQAFLFTNMRDDLIEQGLLKDHWDILTIDNLDKLHCGSKSIKTVL